MITIGFPYEFLNVLNTFIHASKSMDHTYRIKVYFS